MLLRIALLVMVAFDAAAQGIDLNWVGFQGGCLPITPSTGSFFSTTQWSPAQVPVFRDTAIFDDSFDPEANGAPSTIRFGAYSEDFSNCPSNVFNGGSAFLEGIIVASGSYTFELDSQTLEIVGPTTTIGTGGPASLSLRNGTFRRLGRLHLDDSIGPSEVVVGAGGILELNLFTLGSELLGGGGASLTVTSGGLLRIPNPNQADSLVSFGDSLIVQDGGTIDSESDLNLRSTMSVDGPLAEVEFDLITAGFGIHADLFVTNGGTLSSRTAIVAVLSAGTADIVLSGTDSQWLIDAEASLGGVFAPGPFSTVLFRGGGANVTVESGARLAVGVVDIGFLEIFAPSVLDVTGGGSVTVKSLNPVAGAVTVGPAGQLGGDGTIVGDVYIGGLLSPRIRVVPGGSGATLSFVGPLTMEPTAVADFDGGDRIDVDGDVVLDGLLEVSVVAVLPGEVHELITTTGAMTGSFVNAPNGADIPDGANDPSDPPEFTVHYGPTSPFGADRVVLISVPEPALELLALVSLAVVGLSRRHSR